MALIRFKVLAAGVLVAAGLSLSVGSGWYSSATAQYVPPGFDQKGKEAKADPNIEKLRADLEKAKADLLKAEADLTKQKIVEEKRVLQILGDETYRVELSVEPTSKYEYEPVPKSGFTPEELEGKLAKREKAGWAFVGEVTMRSGKELVFRKVPARSQTYLLTTDGKSAAFVPGAPPLPPKPPATPELKQPTPPRPSAPPKEVPLIEVNPARGKVVEDQAKRIAELERIIELLKTVKAVENKVDVLVAKFGPAEFGNWEPKVLAEVLVKLLADEKSGQVKVAIEILKDGLVLKGNQEGIAAAKAWITKLKK